MNKLPYTKENPERKIKLEGDDWEIKVYDKYIMMDRTGFEELLRRGRFYTLFARVKGME